MVLERSGPNVGPEDVRDDSLSLVAPDPSMDVHEREPPGSTTLRTGISKDRPCQSVSTVTRHSLGDWVVVVEGAGPRPFRNGLEPPGPRRPD